MSTTTDTIKDMARGTAKEGGSELQKSLQAGFPLDFQKGLAISTWQCSGSTHGQWDYWVRKPYFKIVSLLTGGCPVEESCDFWNRYKGDIDKAKALGANAFRFSFEWARIEPKQGQVDKEALQRYGEIIDYMIEKGLEPNATLHHYVHPQWFEQMKAFELEDNIPHFVNYAKLCFEHFGSKIRLWTTFNETQVFLVLGYIIGIHPPGKWFRLHLMGQCTRNMLLAHCRAYQAIKKMEGGAKTPIGIVHNSQQVYATKESFITRFLTNAASIVGGEKSYVEFFKSGKLIWYSPFRGNYVFDVIKEAPECIDWWGMNYYSCMAINQFGIPFVKKGQVKTDMGYPIYAEGLSQFIKQVSVLNIPIYITECGVADKKDNLRKQFIEEYFNAVFKCIKENYDVRGFYYWSLIDNYEWSAGYSQKFGLYSFDLKTKQRTMREGAKYLQQMYNQIPSNFEQLKLYLRSNKYITLQD